MDGVIVGLSDVGVTATGEMGTAAKGAGPMSVPTFFGGVPVTCPPKVPAATIVDGTVGMMGEPSVVGTYSGYLFIVPVSFDIPVSYFYSGEFIAMELV